MQTSDQFIKDLESALSGVVQKLKTDFAGIRGNRPSIEAIQEIKVNVYDQSLTVKELGSLNILPPRTVQIMIWDKDAVGAVMKAIEGAHLGLTASNDGNTIRATSSALGDERREELTKAIKKT